MLGSAGLLIVQRYSPVKAPTGGYTALEVLEKYRGFDGIAWPGELVRDVQLIDGLASLDELSRLNAYVSGIGSTEIDLVYCAIEEESDPSGFTFVGYDVGYYCSEYLHYSVVLNEVLYGNEPDLVQYAKRLNANLLFENATDAYHLLETREALLRAGGDLERGDEPLSPVRMLVLQRTLNAR